MIRFAMLVALLAAAPLFGQTKEVVEEVNSQLEQLRIAARHAEERNEDIEILRRLLNKEFGFDNKTSQLPEAMQPYISLGSTAFPPGGSSIPNWRPGYQSPGITQWTGDTLGLQSITALPTGKRVSQAVGPFDGVYLKGSGVVFTLRVPMDSGETGVCVGSIEKELGLGSSCRTCHQDVKAVHAASTTKAGCANCHSGKVTAPLPVSEWDRIKADVRGEKMPEVTVHVADPNKPRAAMCKPGDIRELAVAQLHAHAKNIRHLDKNDWVTVVVTFDEVPGAKPSRIPAPTDQPGFRPDELQSLTLGDLHLKQGKPAEAVAAYEKGLARYRDGVIKLTFPPTVPSADVPKVIAETQKNVRGLYKSLASAYLQVNDLDKARTALDRATSLKVELAISEHEKKAKPRLPAKLVLAVNKSDIDRNPKLEELRKGAHIELIGFPPAEKK